MKVIPLLGTADSDIWDISFTRIVSVHLIISSPKVLVVINFLGYLHDTHTLHYTLHDILFRFDGQYWLLSLCTHTLCKTSSAHYIQPVTMNCSHALSMGNLISMAINILPSFFLRLIISQSLKKRNMISTFLHHIIPAKTSLVLLLVTCPFVTESTIGT